jgi:hypothetical protein
MFLQFIFSSVGQLQSMPQAHYTSLHPYDNNKTRVYRKFTNRRPQPPVMTSLSRMPAQIWSLRR